MKALRAQIGWLAVGQSAVRIAQVVSVMVLIRLMPIDQWNVLALALSVYLVGVTIGSLNLEHSVLAFLPRLEEHQYRTFLSQTRQFLLITGGLTASLVVGAELVFHFLSSFVPAALLALAIFLEIPAVIGGATKIARGEHRAAAMWDLASAAAFLAATFVPAFVQRSATAVVWGLVAYGALRFVAFAVVVSRTEGDPTGPAIDNLAKRQVAFCAPLGLSLALGSLSRAVDKWIVAWHTPDAVGAYVIAAQELPLLAVLPYAGGAAVTAALVRHLSRNDKSGALEIWRAQAAVLCFPVVALSVAVATAAPEVFTLLVPATSPGAATSFAVFSLIGIHRVTEYGVVLRAANTNTHIVESAAVVLAGCVVFGIVGAQLGGLVGVSVGTACAFGVGWLSILRRISQVFGAPVREVFPWREWFRAINVSVTAFAGALLAASVVNGNVARLVMKLVVFATIVRIFVPLKQERKSRLAAA